MSRPGWQDAASIDETWRYTDEQAAAILDALLLPVEDAVRRAEALAAVTEAALVYLGFSASQAERPGKSEVQTQLQEIAEHAGALADLLAQLDPRANYALVAEARSPIDHVRTPIAWLRIVASRAADDYQARGAPPDDVLWRYVNDLLRVWIEYAPAGRATCHTPRVGGSDKLTGTIPTFFRTAAEPVLDAHRLSGAQRKLRLAFAAYRREGLL